jgi:hypothetical protein
MDIGALTQAAYLELLKRLQGSGYASDPDTNRYHELNAVAKIAELASAALQTASANLFLSSASEALDLMERVRFLLQQSSITDARRRDRLLAFARGAAKMVEARLDNAFGKYTGDATGVTRRPDLDAVQDGRSAPAGALVVARGEAIVLTDQEARDLSPVLARGLPAHAIPGAIYDADAVFGNVLYNSRRAVTMFPQVTVPAQTKHRSVALDFHPSTEITVEKWIELQSMLVPKSVGFDFDQAEQGRWIFYQGTIAAAAQDLIDGPTHNGGVNWLNRVIQAWGVVDDAAITDPTINLNSEHVWLSASKTGSSGAAYTHSLWTTGPGNGATSNVVLLVDTNGVLRIQNNAAGTRYVALMIRCSPTYVVDTNGPTQPWINPFQVEHDEVAELYASTVISDDTPGEFAGVDAGALRRIVYSGGMKYGGNPHSVIIDSSEDWRNRWVLVVPIQLRVMGADAVEEIGYPSVASDGSFSSNEEARLFYTGTGATPEQDLPVLAYQHGFFTSPVVESQTWIYADTDGNLRCEPKNSLDGVYGEWDKAYDFMALVIATEQDDGTSVVTPVPVHATRVHAIDLEQPQSCGVFSQGQQGGVPRYSLTDPTPKTQPTNAPLGLVQEGHLPCRPVQWLVRERLGATDDGTYLSRQPILGQRKRVISIQANTAETTPVDTFNDAPDMGTGVNDQVDFRDRLVWIEGRISTSNITIAPLAQNDDSAATRFTWTLYTGPYADLSITLTTNLTLRFEFSRDGANRGIHSRLVIENATGSTYYVNAVVEMSGHLGLSDLRAYGQ